MSPALFLRQYRRSPKSVERADAAKRRVRVEVERLRQILFGTLAIFLGLGLAALWLLSPGAALKAHFQPDECRRLALTDPRTGQPITGVEDLALAPNGDTLILSAHDRRAADGPGGGLYMMNLSAIRSDPPILLRLDAERGGSEVFRPHGIALDPETGALAVINRYRAGAARVEVGPIGPTGWKPEWQIAADRLCRANDLSYRPEGLFETLDRADCGPSLRDLTPWTGTGAVAKLTPDAIIFETDGLSFANGIDGAAIAETRAKAIRMDKDTRIELPGGPDNLTRDSSGALIAAVHPGLLRLFLMREGVFARAGSRIVRLPPGGDVEVLFDDPGGDLISAATVGLMADDVLLMGSATDSGILVCEKTR